MVDIKKLPKSQIEVQVTIEAEEWQGHIDPAVKELAKHVKTEGFRSGKAPRRVVEAQVGREALLSEVAERAIAKNWQHILQKENIAAIGRPQADIQKLEEGSDLEYTIVTSIMPEVEIKSGWKNVVKKAKAQHDKQMEIDGDGNVEDRVEEEVKRLVESRASLATVDREARDGDSAQVDFQVSIDGVPIEGGTAKDHTLILGSGVFIPGFEEQVVGMKVGEIKTFDLDFPEKYHNKSIAGKKAQFEVTLKNVQERSFPELNDEFAQGLGKFENIQELKNSIAEGIRQENKQKQKDARRMAMVDVVVEQTQAEVPDVLIDDELNMMLREFEERVTTMGMSFDDYLAQVKKTREEMKESFEESARKRVMMNLAFSEIAEQEEIQPSSEDVEKKMNETLARYKDIKDIEKKIDMKRLYALSRGEIMNQKVWEMLDNI